MNNPNKRKTYDKEFKSLFDNEQEPNFQNSKKSNENSYNPQNESNFTQKDAKKRTVVTTILVIGVILLIFTIFRMLIKESISQYAYNQGKERYYNSIQSKIPGDLKTKKLHLNSYRIKLAEKRKHKNENSVLNEKNLKDENLERIEIYDTCELIGTLSLKHFYGPPGWGEDTIHDRKENNYILYLTQPIMFLDTVMGSHDWVKIRKIVVVSFNNNFNISEYLNERVEIRCLLVTSPTMHYKAPVYTDGLFDIRKLD